jgi:hypothetical protein
VYGPGVCLDRPEARCIACLLDVAVPQKIVTFQPDDRYVGNLTSSTFLQDTKQFWLDLVPSKYTVGIVRPSIDVWNRGIGFR